MRLPALISACLLSLGGAACALEQPALILSGSNGGVSINPGVGLATQFALETNQIRRLGFVNFLDDLTYLENTINGTVNEISYSNLRVGSPDFTPTVDGLIKMFPDKPSKRDQEAERASLQSRLRTSEQEFWSSVPAYDGAVTGAYNGQYLMLAIPSKRAILFYENANENLVLKAWYNIGPALFVNSVIKSEPDPAKIIPQLNLDADERKALDGAFNGKSDETPRLQPPQFWCLASSIGFALIDSANLKIITFAIPGKKVELRSVRNLTVDLMIPEWHTLPTEADAVAQFKRSRPTQLAEAGITILDVPYVKALVSQTAVGDSAKAGSFQPIANGNILTLTFPAARKILSYNLQGANNGLQLISVRDTTFDAGLAILEQQFRARSQGMALLKTAERDVNSNPTAAFNMVKAAMNFAPYLHVVVEKSSVYKPLSKQADWDKVMAEATKAADAAKAKKEAIDVQAKAEREKKKARK